MTDVQLIKIDNSNHYFINDFLSNAGKSLISFRYFARRPLTVIQNHLCTYLLFHNNEPVCYGHLDKEGDKVWLGIAVSEKYTGKGLGKTMMEYLLQAARNNMLKGIYLSVDKDNFAAIELYQKFGFVLQKNTDTYLLYYLKISG
ncbi:GNAT family N-acetyltransferase [Ferruginibacter albus]|uniref:GNAT family N-acetyltransferase n=1 Tax=Ferruginibacter albus TaxID=2875540 RepID=UPI001CC7DD6F|nr:GNAT family N-acetyltransferase [Ferruginibacter albus]UAY52236.1 GNAT family N-acetyltransferase [Ferruginibacter albus]